jgi:hypothetical protein
MAQEIREIEQPSCPHFADQASAIVDLALWSAPRASTSWSRGADFPPLPMAQLLVVGAVEPYRLHVGCEKVSISRERGYRGLLCVRVSSSAGCKLLVLVRNKHPPPPAHDGKRFSEVIDESSNGRQHASGRREDQVDDPFWCAPLGQDMDERATAHVVHATVLGQERYAEPRERGGTQHPEVFATQTRRVNVTAFFACRAYKIPPISIHLLAHRDRRQ